MGFILSSSSSSLTLLFILFIFNFPLISGDNFTGDGIANIDSTIPSVTASQFLSVHNAARKSVRVPPLVWDTNLSSFARGYADERRGDCTLVHSPGYAYGENIFWGFGRRWSATTISEIWVAERKWYHYKNNSCDGPDCTHYTQIIWRTTKRLGCAKIVCDSGDTFAVCEYYPPGDYIGARPYEINP